MLIQSLCITWMYDFYLDTIFMYNNIITIPIPPIVTIHSYHITMQILKQGSNYWTILPIQLNDQFNRYI